jgi:hypothetical protein
VYPLAEEVAVAAVPLVVALGVPAVHAVHEPRQVCCRSLEQQVVVVPHQAVRTAANAELSTEAVQQPEEPLPVGVVHEERLVRHGTRRHVEDPVGETASRLSRHRMRS